MNDIVIVNFESELRTDSRDLASHLDHRHRTIAENIRKYEREFHCLGSLPFQTEVKEREKGATTSRYWLLNEDQCYFLLTLMRNNDHVVRSKLALVVAFRDARTQLAKRDIARLDGKEVRKMETSAIADLIEYAKAKGSKGADKYYLSVTRMTNDLLGIESGQRDNLDARALGDISVMEKIVANAISDGINAGLPYKEIFQLAKSRCSMALPAIGVTRA